MVRGTRKDWKKRIANQQASGLSTKKWCEKEGINFFTFRHWWRKFKSEGATLKVLPSPPPPVRKKVTGHTKTSEPEKNVHWLSLGNEPIRKQLSVKYEKDGLVIEISSSFEQINELTEIVKELKALC